MADNDRPQRSPFGHRSEEEKSLPFGARPPARASDPYEAPRRQRRESEAPPDEMPVDEAAEGEAVEASAAYPDFPVWVDEPAEDDEFYDEGPDSPDPYDALDLDQRRESLVVEQWAVEPVLPAEDEPAITATEAAKPAAQAAGAIPGRDVAVRFGVLFRSMGVIFVSAALVATIFTWWTPNAFLPAASVEQLAVALATQSGEGAFLPTVPAIPTTIPTLVPAINNVGLVAGHRGIHPDTGVPDPGAVCDDGLTEAEINEAVTNQTAELLRGHGYEVDIFDEFDPRLDGYSANALISIHADTCATINDLATGFKVASFAESASPEEDQRLVSCLVEQYAGTTGLPFHPSVTYDMTLYHTFREVATGTPGAIIEIGFLNLDRELLTEHQDVVALGVARGILCYLRNDPTGEQAPIISGTSSPPPPTDAP